MVKNVVAYGAATALVVMGFLVEAPWARVMLLVSGGGSLAAAAIAMIVAAVGFHRQWRRFVTECSRGVAAIARGELAQAHDLFWSWSQTTKLPTIAANARHNLGWTLMRQGELQQAAAVLADNVERHAHALSAVSLLPTTMVDLALIHALLGDFDRAEHWMAETAKASRERALPSLPAMECFARAVIDCRSGRCPDAARMLAERWAECEALLTGDVVRPLRVVLAFAMAAEGPRNAGVAEAEIATTRPTYDREFDFLGVDWPEMSSFLVSHRLAC